MSRWQLLVVSAALAGSVHPWARVRAAGDDRRVEFEDALLRVQRITIGAGESLGGGDRRDGVLVSFTADLDGRMPRPEASWQAASQPLANHAGTRFEGLLVEVKGSPSSGAASLPAELASANGSHYEYAERGDHTAVSLLDNDRVVVTRHRMAPLRWTERYHAHARESVFVYLRGGQLTGASALDGYHPARRGAFDVLPAEMWHALYNGGNDPIEFVAIWPK